MTTKSFFGVILIAALAGFLGGALSSRKVEAAGPQIVRASDFELVSPAGVVLATWKVDAKNEVHLRFRRGGGSSVLDIGVGSDGNPVFKVFGKDGTERINMGLGSFDKPSLMMSDDHWMGRVELGYIDPDTVNPASDNWGLSFHAVGSERTIAGIGMTKAADGRIEGDVTIEGKRFR
jgi:hypothetical protein